MPFSTAFLNISLLLIIILSSSSTILLAAPAGGANPQLQWNNAGTLDGVPFSSVDSGGNVGIGTSAIYTRFSVFGTNNQTITNTMNISPSGFAGVNVQGLAAGSSSPSVYMQAYNQSFGGSRFGQALANSSILYFAPDPSRAGIIGTIDVIDLVIGTNNTERARFNSAGNVGIGSVDPMQVLDVNGYIRTSNGSAGKAACFKADKSIGYCSTQPDVAGACTCN